MKNPKFVVFDNDEAYAVRLSAFFEKQEMFSFDTVCFTKADALLEFTSNKDDEAIVLASESAMGKIEEKLDKKNLIVLSESGAFDDQYESTYKYQPGDAIYRDVMKILSEKPVEYDALPKQKKKPKNTNEEVYAFFSPADSVLQSMLAVSLGLKEAQSGKKVIYLNMGSFNAFGDLKMPAQGIDILDLMTYAQGNIQTFQYRLGSAIQKIGELDVISQAFSYLDVLQIENESWEKLISLLSEAGRYNLIILDLSVTIRSLPQMLYCADRCISVYPDTPWALSQQEHFEQLMKELGFEAVIEKLDRIKVPARSDLPENFSEIENSRVSLMAEAFLKEML